MLKKTLGVKMNVNWGEAWRLAQFVNCQTSSNTCSVKANGKSQTASRNFKLAIQCVSRSKFIEVLRSSRDLRLAQSLRLRRGSRFVQQIEQQRGRQQRRSDDLQSQSPRHHAHQRGQQRLPQHGSGDLKADRERVNRQAEVAAYRRPRHTGQPIGQADADEAQKVVCQ